jgi:hypothetical protein
VSQGDLAFIMTRMPGMDPCSALRPRIALPAVTDFISLPFYDLFHENGHVPEIREKLPALLAGVQRSILEIGAGTGLITTAMSWTWNWTSRLRRR